MFTQRTHRPPLPGRGRSQEESAPRKRVLPSKGRSRPLTAPAPTTSAPYSCTCTQHTHPPAPTHPHLLHPPRSVTQRVYVSTSGHTATLTRTPSAVSIDTDARVRGCMAMCVAASVCARAWLPVCVQVRGCPCVCTCAAASVCARAWLPVCVHVRGCQCVCTCMAACMSSSHCL